ncbi:sugar phosphate isomerase/epimerase family protein [Kitasatospora sp. NPDC006697]|uniref:sugar phosphate isomerase/epimerase family protein n=1 Tax=Kitasatospora sp. NPDC006697 TaxID=3364020 RepID=UPI0036C34AC3
MNWTDRSCGIGDEAAAGLTEQLAIHRELGLGAIELRTVDGRGLHQLAAAELAEVAAEVAASGLAVPAVDTPIGNWGTTIATDLDGELAVLAGSAAAAHAFGTRWLRVMSYPNDGRPEPQWAAAVLDRMAVLTREAERLDVVLLHENCQGWAGQGPAQTLRMLEHVASPALRLIFDVGNGLAYGYQPEEFLAEVLPFVDHVHIKDGHRTADGAVFTEPGTGELDLAACLRLLEDAGYRGRYSMEPHVAHIPHLARTADAAELAAGYRACTTAFQRLWEKEQCDG